MPSPFRLLEERVKKLEAELAEQKKVVHKCHQSNRVDRWYLVTVTYWMNNGTILKYAPESGYRALSRCISAAYGSVAKRLNSYSTDLNDFNAFAIQIVSAKSGQIVFDQPKVTIPPNA